MTNKEGVVDAGSKTEIEAKIHTESDTNASFLRAARAANLEKVLEYLKGNIDINTSNVNGLNALHLASKEGHVNLVQELVKRGANVNAATKKGNTALHIASLAGKEDVAKILIRHGANPNAQSQNGFTPLYMAAQENHDGVVKLLLANGANQSLATEDGFTPLAVALQQGHDKVVAVLLENDAKGRVRLPALHIAAKKDDCKAAALLLQSDHDPDVTSKSGFTPLHIAAHYGNENIAALLLEKNADVNYSAKHQITPLHVAAKWGKSNMVTLLIDKGAKIDASTRDGLTPLHCAARSGHDQVVDLLLEKGAPITAKTKNGLAPLHMASQGDHVDSARILLYHKAPVDDVTVDYLTALHVAAHCGHVRVAKLLLDRKADPNSRALNGFTPLHIACKKNRIKVVELLLKHGASIEATTESGLTPLHVASFMGCMNIVIFLITNGANPDVPTVRGETPLHLAARANQSDIIRILLRNGAHVDASAREQQTPLHIAARLGNVDIVGLLLQHGAAVDAPTKDMYTALHIAAKEGQEEVASVLLDHAASLTSTTKKGFTPLHLAAKYGNIKVARLLLQKDAPVDAQGKNGVTPLHVAAHYDHVNVALLLLDKGAFPHATAKNGYTPLHIAAKKNQMDIATTLLEYGAKPSAESKAGFTPLHLAAQEGHTDMTTLLIEHHADVNAPAKNGLTPLHLCAQEDKVNVAAVLVKNGAKVDPPTKAGYTPLHVACHFGQINMIRFLLQHGADVNSTTSHGYTPLHQAAQQGHTLIINLLLEHKASPNTTTNQGQTALSIAQRLGYISVVETLKIVTETVVTTTTTTITEEKYKVVAPETMQETFMSDSEDEGGDDIEDTSLYGKPAHATHVYLPYIEGQKLLMTDDTMMGDQSLHYMTTDELKALADDNTLGIDVTRDERGADSTLIAPLTAEEDHLTPQHVAHQEATFSSSMASDNVDLARAPVHAGFLVSFMVDARGGAMRGCRHSGVRVIIPPRKAPMPMRITCRYLRKEKLAYPPPLMEGEACASRILEVGPSGAKFLGPVIIEVPHFASLRGREREITILRSDNGESWREHTLEASDDAVHDVFNESFEGEELTAIEDLSTNRITRILTTDFPQYFAIITRIRQEVHAIGPEGGMVSSTVVPQVQAIFPEGALTKKIKVGLQAHPISPELVTKLLGNRVAVSPIVTVEPRRRKFHKSITLTIPVPQAATKGMINQYSGDAPTLRLLCSITGGTTKAQWEDVTGSTPLTFVNDCVSFTTTVSARFWLMDCRQVNEATKFATELYREAIHVPFMAKFVVFAKRRDPLEAQLRVFCMTDDKEDKTLESQEHFTEVAKSRDVEVLEGKLQYLEFAGNLVPVTKSGEQLSFTFQAFRENRLPFTIRVKDTHQEPMGRVAFMREARVGRGEAPQAPICNLNIVLPDPDLTPVSELVTLEKKYGFVQETSLAKPELIHRADLRLSDIAKELGNDWVPLALQLDVPEAEINSIRCDHPGDNTQQALAMLRHWLQRTGSKANGNLLEKGLRKINREDIVNHCIFNVELVTDDVEKAVAKVHLDQSGFDTFKEELGSSRDASLRRDTSLNGTFDEQDIMKDAESAAETSSESSDKDALFRSDSRHAETRAERRHHRHSGRSFEDGPETLVQTVPTTMSESFTQHLTNGQMSDTSMHEEDRSEQTAATFSSEANAEMEASSFEDKSQGETHVDKKEWTETDDSGSVRQITQIKTETSIKLEGDGIRRSLRKIPRKESSDEEKKSTDSEQEDLSFTEKKSFFQRLSLTSDTLPTTQEKWAQDVSLDDLPMAEGEIVQEQISFEDKFKMFEPDEGNRKKIQKREKPEQPTVYLYNFTKNDKPVSAEQIVSELEKAEGIVNGDLSPETMREEKEAELHSAVALEKVEQEVYSLISEVDKEEKKLHSYQDECSDSEGMSPGDHKHVSDDERLGDESETDVSKDVEFFKEKSYTTMIEADESISSYQVRPLSSGSDDETERKFSIDLCKQEEHNEAIKLDVDDDSIEETRRHKKRPSNLDDLSSVVDSHIKSEILREEIDQIIEESPLEVKQIAEDLERISESDDHKCNVYKHIRTEIFTQELGQDIESGSPERKELGAFSMKKSDSPSHIVNAEIMSSHRDLELEISLDKKSLSPQISEESCGLTDDISSEGIVVEHDDHLVEYEEAIDEHSLTEQLQALASDSMNAQKPFFGLEQHETLDFRSQDYDHMSSGMSSTFPDLDMHRRSKEIGFSRHDKKEIRSLKSTKQVSTIEEHSSIESCDSPQELILHELPEKYDSKEHLAEVSQKPDLDQDKDQLPVISEPHSSSLSSQSNEHSDKGLHMSRSDSKSSQGKKSDSDAEGSKFDNLSDASGKKEKESCSSSGETESPYYSVETSDSGKTPRSTPAASRPCSSEFDVNVFSGHGSEYETCVSSQGASGEVSGSYATAVSSQEISYATACSSFSHSSRESAYSVDSESSGHLASVEVSSEASETLVPSAQEMELEFAPDLEMPVLDEEPASEESVKEPYDMEIPESIIREGVEMPFMTSWEMNRASDDEKMKQLPQQWSWQYATESEITDKFEVLDASEDKSEARETSLKVSEQPEHGCANKVKSENTVQYYPQVGTSPHAGPSHRRSYSSVIDIIPDKELMEQQNSIVIEEEQLSVSESSATHSEQTWQTSSVDTAVQLSSHAPTSFPADGSNLMSDSLQETPPEKELTPEQSYSSQHGSSFLQLNGPIEVDYNPEYDNPEGDDSELTTNQNQTPILYETEGLQFDLELEGSSAGTQAVNDNNSLPSSSNVHDLEFDHESLNLGLDEPQIPNSSSDYDSHNISSLDAEKPEAQQEQSFNFNDYRNHESESFVCSDFASYLPESDQCDLLPGGDSLPPSFESEINIPCAESASSSEGVSHRETRSDLIPDRQSMESLERVEIIDTSPEDERYESVKPTCTDKSPSDDMNASPALKFTESDVLNPESDYSSHTFSKYDEVPGTDLYTHHEEDEFDLRGSDVYPSPIPSVDDDKQSTPSSEAFHGRRFFPRSGDTSAASSLQEFERLEAEIAAGRISRSSIDSSEKVMVTKSGEHDDVSMSSLTEFEKLERECVENESENKAAMEEMMLSEIEEGIESQCSDAIEILQESMHDASDLEYEQRRLEMEELIKVTQSNVEKFQEETASEGITSDECTVLVRVTSEVQDTSENTKSSSKEEGNTDVDESENLPLTQDKDYTIAQDSSSSGEKNCVNGKLDLMVSSTDSMDPSSSTATHATYQFETDSVMSSSLNSAQASGEECTMVSSTDTLEPEPILTYTVCESGETTHLAKSGDSVLISSKGALACKLEELQATNGAKQQMEMFLSKLTDDTVLMDDFTSHSFPDVIEGTDRHTEPDDFIESTEAAQGISSSGDAAFDSDDLLSRSTTTTTTRIVTTVTTGDNDDGDHEESGTEDLRHSVEVILNQFMSDGDSSKQEDSHLGSEE
ncbi:ankyrin-2 isoform X4 [Parasteatoda tepidariorum]|uniref:ankyrin-2 isoform X4 n=1 Tax=Parasteatoda tepidariorum TaxID=114398 RepID=UPI0039BD3901